MNKFLILFIFFFVVVLTGSIVYREGTLPVNKNNKTTKIFVVKPGQAVSEIANNLVFEGLIRNRLVFYLITKQQQADKNIQAGDFRLSPSMDIFEIVKNLQHGTLDSWVTIIEGLRKEEVAQIFSNKFQIPEIEFVKQAKEGYLFPDTYLIPIQATSEMILDILNKNFEKKYSLLKEKAKQLPLKDSEIIVLASLVEREARFNQDRPLVASVILNRLKIGMKLDIDATVQYALGYQSKDKSWWKINLTMEDLEIDSPYNTYKNPGLPPSAIANPGLAAIKAVIDAPDTDYLYYISDKDGHLHYGKTLEDHQENIRKYLER